MRVFARRHLRQIAGMVLVDPPAEREFARAEKVAPGIRRSVEMEAEQSRKCASAHELTGACEPGMPDDAPASIAAALRSRSRLHFLTQAAEMESMINGRDDAEIDAAGTDLGGVPLVVLTSEQFKLNTAMPAETRAAVQQLWMTMHDEIARHSTRGTNRLVTGTGHYIQLERPDAVIEAVEEVAGEAGRR